ncbi:MAG: ABC transporter permease [Acidimicrobiales bacterium]
MGRFLRQRLIRAVLILLVGSFFVYGMMRILPNDPTIARLGTSATKEARAALLDQWNLSGNIFEGYVNWFRDAITGDLGTYLANNIPVTTILSNALVPSLQLMLYAQILAIVGAFLVGMAQAYFRGSWFDRAMNGWTSLLISTPQFVLGLWLAIYVALQFDFLGLKPTGYTPLSEDVFEHFKLILLPALTLAAAPFATYTRLLRTDMIATLQEDYILMARSKGLSPSFILVRHGLKPSLFSLITSAGLNIGALIGGAVAVEQTFAIPGLGRNIVSAVLAREYFIVQGGFLIVVLFFVLSNLLVELLYGVLDPRVRLARSLS